MKRQNNKPQATLVSVDSPSWRFCPLVVADERYIIDAKQNTVCKTDDPDFSAVIIQTQYGSLRDHPDGKKIGVEVLHICETPDGETFVIDQSQVYINELN